jgi:hypothetical protein
VTQTTLTLLYSLFWVIPQYLNFMCPHFGTDSVLKHRHIKFGCRGITQNKEYNIQSTVKVLNQEKPSIYSVNFFFFICLSEDRVALWVQRLATGWTVWGSNPGGAEIFCTCPNQLWGPPSLLYNEYQIFPWGKDRTLTPHPLLVPFVMKE